MHRPHLTYFAFSILLHLDCSKFQISISSGRLYVNTTRVWQISVVPEAAVRTLRLCVFVICTPQSSRYDALGSSLQLLQPWVGVPSLLPAQFSWQQKSRRRSKCARGPTDCRSLWRGARLETQRYVTGVCPGIARGGHAEVRLRETWSGPWSAQECRARRVLTRSELARLEWREGFSSLCTNVNHQSFIKPFKKPWFRLVQWQRSAKEGIQSKRSGTSAADAESQNGPSLALQWLRVLLGVPHPCARTTYFCNHYFCFGICAFVFLKNC